MLHQGREVDGAQEASLMTKVVVVCGDYIRSERAGRFSARPVYKDKAKAGAIVSIP